jgi:hypothetical protein
MYELILNIHNTVGSLTLLLTIVTALMLLITARVSTTFPAIALRATLISASLQALLGITLLVMLLTRSTGYAVSLWLHYALGLTAVALVSVVVARARRSSDSAARRYGGMMLGVVVVVLLAFLAGQFRLTV